MYNFFNMSFIILIGTSMVSSPVILFSVVVKISHNILINGKKTFIFQTSTFKLNSINIFVICFLLVVCLFTVLLLILSQILGKYYLLKYVDYYNKFIIIIHRPRPDQSNSDIFILTLLCYLKIKVKPTPEKIFHVITHTATLVIYYNHNILRVCSL